MERLITAMIKFWGVALIITGGILLANSTDSNTEEESDYANVCAALINDICTNNQVGIVVTNGITDYSDICAGTNYSFLSLAASVCEYKVNSVYIDVEDCEDLVTIYVIDGNNTNLYEMVNGIITPVIEIITEEVKDDSIDG